jgi:hypothetical protein
VLAATLPVEKMPHINFDCGTEDSYYGYNQDFLLILLARKVPFTYSQSPGAHASAYWRREVGTSMAIQHEIIRRNLAAKAKVMPTSVERLRDLLAEIPGERLRSQPHPPE